MPRYTKHFPWGHCQTCLHPASSACWPSPKRLINHMKCLSSCRLKIYCLLEMQGFVGELWPGGGAHLHVYAFGEQRSSHASSLHLCLLVTKRWKKMGLFALWTSMSLFVPSLPLKRMHFCKRFKGEKQSLHVVTTFKRSLFSVFLFHLTMALLQFRRTRWQSTLFVGVKLQFL